MNLIYINKIGSDYTGQDQYEFIFSEYEGDMEMDSWYSVPASVATEPLIPDIEYISAVTLLKNTDLKLDLIQNSDTFGVIDAVDGVIALGWEVLDPDNDEVERLTFHFGDDAISVINKLQSREYKLVRQTVNAELVNEESEDN